MSTHLNCANCGIDFCMPSQRVADLRESHETFYCPNGHRNHFPAQTEAEKKIERLEQRLGWARDEDARHYGELKRRTMEAATLLRACPAEGCNWVSPCHIRDHFNFSTDYIVRVRKSVAEHMAAEHGAELPDPEPVEVEHAA